jgi:catechol 2,3-dioxygenase-like lactoylglutathione lyase family enzyme
MDIQSTFSGFSVDDIEAAKHFYGGILGFAIKEKMGGIELTLPGGAVAWVYQKDDHSPAVYTMLNLVVDDIDAACDALAAKDVRFEDYTGLPQDEKGIMRGKAYSMGPDIAWFKDPARNILAVLEN